MQRQAHNILQNIINKASIQADYFSFRVGFFYKAYDPSEFLQDFYTFSGLNESESVLEVERYIRNHSLLTFQRFQVSSMRQLIGETEIYRITENNAFEVNGLNIQMNKRGFALSTDRRYILLPFGGIQGELTMYINRAVAETSSNIELEIYDQTYEVY